MHLASKATQELAQAHNTTIVTAIVVPANQDTVIGQTHKRIFFDVWSNWQ
jgi:hypothetical protein